MFWNRGWNSIGRAIRISQLLELHGLDDPEDTEHRIQKYVGLNDWTDIEGARRMFWYLFSMDRCSAVITGRPMTINESDEVNKLSDPKLLTNPLQIFILLPTSESAYQSSQPQPSVSWTLAQDVSVTSISSYSSSTIIAGVYGGLARHLHRRDSKTDQTDVIRGSFWKRHWELDAKINRLQMILPEIARTDPDFNEASMLSIRLQLQSLTIGLYKAASVRADMFNLDQAVSQQCASRITAAAEEVVQIMRDVSAATYQMVSSFYFGNSPC